MKWRDLAERQILKAKAEGQLEDLTGAGKPLKMDGGNTTDAAGFRIMADAGVLPREIELRKAIEDTQAELVAATDPDVQKAVMSKLADLQMRLSIEQEARRKYYAIT